MESHVMPRSIRHWLKSTSATGFLRQASEPNRRAQDGVKEYPMCADCDGGLLSPSEKQFKELPFLPYHANKHEERPYGPSLHHFAASLTFRVLLIEQAWHEERDGVNFQDFERPLKYLRRYLRGLTSSTSDLEHYVTLTDDLDNSIRYTETKDVIRIDRGLPGKLGFHLLRSVDSFALTMNGRLMTFVQMPGFLFATVLKPRRYRGSLGTRIQPAGGVLSFSAGQMMRNDLYPMVEERSRELDKVKVSPGQARSLEAAIRRSPERWNASETGRLARKMNR